MLHEGKFVARVIYCWATYFRGHISKGVFANVTTLPVTGSLLEAPHIHYYHAGIPHLLLPYSEGLFLCDDAYRNSYFVCL